MRRAKLNTPQSQEGKIKMSSKVSASSETDTKSESESFIFKLAEKEGGRKKQWKAREGVAVAGCTMTQFWWGREPTWDFEDPGGDGGVFC